MLDELAGQVRSGRIDPVDLVEESLRRIAADDHNAVIRVETDSARAAAATHPRASGRWPGCPCRRRADDRPPTSPARTSTGTKVKSAD
jgi:Asp-tRNA(Asn)/Glu-tRNA(Gln) amidotransferase A subunit family amidase